MEKGQGKRTDTLHRDNDYLRRGDVKRLLENVVCLHEELPAQIDLIPAADVVPARHGQWKWELADNGWANHICSECGYTKNTDVHVRMDYDYCPNCGARMDDDGDA